jgi:ferredoxin-NADP reductase
VALIGAGEGITPLRALAEGLDYAPGDAIVLYRFTSAPLFEREFQVLQRERGLQVRWLPGRRRFADSWLGAGAGRADDVTALLYWVPDIAERDVYVCGPEPWMADVRRCAEAAGVPPERLHIESFSW